MSTAQDWSTAYARQAQADWKAYECLLRYGPEAELPNSEALHFLQMAVEKLVKAHLYPTFSNPESLQSTHAVVAKHLPTIFKTIYARHQGATPSGSLMKEVRAIAAEIHYLHPQNDGGGVRPDNSEYPWPDNSGTIQVPAEHTFAHFSIIRTNPKWWIELVKILKLEIGRISSGRRR